ncbi:helicase associated domain-containing protein [Rhodococcus sp. NM-2]|uniref:helicase associated domain-containing protein n=1 Tax=Rhodococcus sp. NM-2 TaxID=3401174 RepID=UPI003AAAC874
MSGWTWNSIDDQWDEGFEHLLRYVLEHQDARVAFDYNATDQYALGKWVARQRAAYTKRTLNPERQRRLEEVPGWTWDPLADKWEEGFKHLADFVETHGHARVPYGYKANEYGLGSWVRKQRARYLSRNLDPDRQHRLQNLNGWEWETSSR